MKTTELKEWMREAIEENGCSVPMVINGGGFSYYGEHEYKYIDGECHTIKEDGEEFEVWDVLPLFDDDYSDEVEILEKGTEFADFKGILSEEEYNDMTFVRVKHLNGYNQENCDIQIGMWELS